jgi:hypothetical protein
MNVFDDVVRDIDGVIVSGAKVYVYGSDGTLASLFESDGTTPKDNPLVSDTLGQVKAWLADDGYYTAEYFWGGRKRYVRENVLLGTSPIDQTLDNANEAASILTAIQLLAAGIIFDTPADGVAVGTGVAPGEFFCTWEDARLRVYLNNAGVAVLKIELLTEALMSTVYAKLADLASSASSKGPGLLGLSHASTYANGTVGAHLKAFVVASDAPFNVRGDNSTDNAAGINAALAHCHSLGGGDVILPGGRIRHSATIDIKYPRIRLIGRGGDYVHDSGTNSTTRTVLVPTFAGTALKIRTPYASEQGVPANQTQKYWYAGARDFIIDCNSVATKACEIDSVSGVDVRLYATGCVGTDCFEVKCGQSGIDLGEACDVQYSNIWVAARLIDTVAERSCNILKLSGSAGAIGTGANVSLNRGPHSGITVAGQHWNGHALVATSADNNDISILAFRAGGSGRSIYAHGPTASIVVGFEDNTVKFLTGAGAAYAEGTDTAGVTAGVRNIVQCLDIANGSPLPTAGTGSFWDVKDGKGVNYVSMHDGVVIADDPNVARTERASFGSESLRIRNASEQHVILTDGTNSWSLAVVSATGDVRISRLSGTGSVNVGNGAPVKIGNKLVTEGASDSGGTGYRVLRVAN